MVLSYEIIRAVHREEESSSELSKLPDGFLESLKDYVADLEKEVRLKNYNFEDEEFRKYINIKKMIEDIFYLRYNKIFRIALYNAKNNEEKIENLSRSEQKAYNELVKATKKYLSLYFEKRSQEIEVKILQDIPRFMGPELKEYGPFKEGDVVSLPEEVVKILESKNLCKRGED